MKDNEFNLGSGPVEEAYITQMKELAGFIDQYFNPGAKTEGEKKTGFVLLVYPLNSTEGRCNYLSNSNRKDVKVLLKEQLSYFEGMPDNLPSSKRKN